MARVRIKGLKKQAKLLRIRANRLARIAIADPKLGRRIKNRLIDPIRKEGILPDGSSVRGIRKKWAVRRSRLAEFNQPSRFWRRFYSNLTFTGKFLSSFKTDIQKTSRGVRYRIEPSGTHPGYKNVRAGETYKSGKKKGQTVPARGESVSNSKIGEGQIDQGRDYRVISQRNLDKIEKTIRGRIRRELKLRLKNL